jgi:phosphohistidine swiveling domain-containing protein
MKRMIIASSEEAIGEPIGGKAANLFRLHGLGFNVPRFVVIPAEAEFNATGLLDALNGVFPPDPSRRFAVRSSALAEDGKEHSHAGQFETFLFVPLEEVPQKVNAVRASATSERVRLYRSERGLEGDTGIGVIIQEMVDADRSGVAFGSDPSTGDPLTKVISAVYGLGEGLVSGELDADTWFVRPQGTEERIVPKERMVVRNTAGNGTRVVTVEASLQQQASLGDTGIKTITDTLARLEKEFGAPQDIEFAFAGGEFFLLQARPITTKPRGEYTVWDNSNIVESYPGITTQLTFSFILKMYEAVYIQFCDLLGVDGGTITRNKHVFANTLGRVRGRVYYNLLNWYKMLAMVPGYRINARFMENMMGVKERFELKEEHRMGKAAAWWRIVKMVFRMLWLQWRLPKERARFQRHLDATMERYGTIDFNALPAEAIIEHYRVFERTLLKEWKAPLINDFFAMIWFGVLQKLCARWVPGAPNLHNDLLCGSRDIISTEPIHACMAIARVVSDDAQAKTLFLEHGPAQVWSELMQGRFPEVKRATDDYLHRFGERCVGELKLETVSHAQDPPRFIAIIRGYVEKGITRSRERGDTDEGLRLRAEAACNAALRGKPVKRWLLRSTLNRARDLVSARENLRFERTRGFGMVRRMFSALGERWAADGLIPLARDIFHLDLSEILDPKRMELWPAVIEERKKRAALWAAEPPPSERFFTYGNDFNDAAIHSTEKLMAVQGDLQGIGCCPGVVEALVRKVLDPSSVGSLDGDILVTSSTDPGWVTLFPSCSAILVERGSLLSHSAIVSREMGIPCIVSVPGLLRTLATGDRVRMDGSTGLIKVIKKGERAST